MFVLNQPVAHCSLIIRNADIPIPLIPSYLSSFCIISSFFLFLPHNTALTITQMEQGKGDQGKEDENGVLVRCPKWGQRLCPWALTDLAEVAEQQMWLSLLRDIWILFMKCDIILPLLPLFTFPPIESFNLLCHSENVSFPTVKASWMLMFQYHLPSCGVRDFLRYGLLTPLWGHSGVSYLQSYIYYHFTYLLSQVACMFPGQFLFLSSEKNIFLHSQLNSTLRTSLTR